MASDIEIWDAFDSAVVSALRKQVAIRALEPAIVDGTLMRVRITRETLLASMARRIQVCSTETIHKRIFGRMTENEIRDARRHYAPLGPEIQRRIKELRAR